MEDLKAGAWLIRWAAKSLLYNLSFIPEEKRDWKPTPECKSALAIAGEVTAICRSMQPVLSGGEWIAAPWPHPTTLEEATEMLTRAAEEYSRGLESCESDLERPVSIFGNPLLARRAVFMPVIDMLHHHGQITYLQCLLGDGEMHFDMESGVEAFSPPHKVPAA